MDFSLASMNATAGYLEYDTNKDQIMSDYSTTIICSFIFIICCIGVPLNGIVIWLLGFQIKRNPFTVLILNLTIADFGFLIFMALFPIEVFIHFIHPGIPLEIVFFLFNFTYITGLFLLTAISIDRCVCVLFPIWYQCSQPKYLSSAVSAFLWIFSFLLIGMYYIRHYFFLHIDIQSIHLVVTAVICLPLIIISTMILFIKICLQSKQMKRGRLFVMILITLLCFLILSIPLYSLLFVTHINKENFFVADKLSDTLSLTSSLNCSIKPVIYFLVGRKKRAQTRESIKSIFQRIFREDEAPEI